MMNKLWFGMNLKEAIDDRVVYVSPDNTVWFEENFDKVDMISENVKFLPICSDTSLFCSPTPFRSGPYMWYDAHYIFD